MSTEVDLAPLAALASRWLPGGEGPFECQVMPGGASTRRYFRVRRGPVSAVAMYVPDGTKAEEVVHGSPARARWPFLEVRDLLASRGVDVPALLAEDTARGWLLIEDLGDETLAAYLAAHPDAREALYVGAVTGLARAQAALRELPAGSIVASRAFDEDLLLWELHHFREWVLDARGCALEPAARARFDGIAGRLAARIAGWPRVFVHRDYQSRNLMVRSGGELCWLDFQDALLGPRIYDVVALLNDSYQVFDRPFVEARIDDYARAAGIAGEGRAVLGREFDLVTVQRKLKDAGRFIFIDRVKGNPSFLRFVEPTLAKARASLARLADDEDMRALTEVLSGALPA